MWYLLGLLAKAATNNPSNLFCFVFLSFGLNFIKTTQQPQCQKHTVDDLDFLLSLRPLPSFASTAKGQEIELVFQYMLKIFSLLYHAPACFLLCAYSFTCSSAGASATVLWWRMSEVVAHTAIRGDGSVRERVRVWCEPDSTEGLFNRARRDRWHAFITAWWVNTCEKLLPALSIKLSSALLSLTSLWPAQRLEDQLRRDERRGSQLFCGPRLSRHVPTKRWQEP